jgi:glycosyltransferase involved in cell wall biosynthesis
VTTANHFARSLFARTIDRGKRFNPLHRYMDAKFLDGDIVYLIGASWNVKGMLQSLVALKVERNLRLITHINDILPIYQPQLFAEELHELFEPYVLQVIEHSSLLTVISQATKRDIEIFINQKDLPQVPIEVITLGDNPLAGKVKRPAGIAKNDEDFLFVLGTFEIRKNYQLLYQVVKLSQLEAKPIPKIIIAGRRGWLSSDLIHQIKHDPYASKQIVWLEHVSDEESAWLLNNCLFTVFPSLCEGWGLPVSESLKSGRFCLVSGVSSMLEFDEKLVDYFLPYDPRECLEKIRYYLHDRRYIHRNEEVSKNYQPVSWDDCFNEVARAVSAIKREV